MYHVNLTLIHSFSKYAGKNESNTNGFIKSYFQIAQNQQIQVSEAKRVHFYPSLLMRIT